MVYYSGKIEGNTYTYVETEALLKDGITSEKQYENAKMLKNLHNLFVSEMEYIHKGKNTEIIDERTLLRLDSGLSSGLVSDEEAGQFRTRPVRISGIDYVPPRDVYEIRFRYRFMRLVVSILPQAKVMIHLLMFHGLKMSWHVGLPGDVLCRG